MKQRLTRILAAALAILAFNHAHAVTLLGPVEGQKQARELVDKLLAIRPTENSTNFGVLKIREWKKKAIEIPIKFSVIVTATNWQAVYETQIVATNGGFTFARSHFGALTIVHLNDGPHFYQVPNVNPPPQETDFIFTLTGDQLATPFAGSDFWLADLGLEFLNWPAQRILKKEIKRSCGCSVLESLNPDPKSKGYSRVLTWIDNDSLGVVQAEAYDAQGNKLKEFLPTSLGKVNGQMQVEEIEMDNVQTRSRTLITFDLDR